MTTEFILLLMSVLLVSYVIVNGVRATFEKSGPKLGARVEKHLETGSGFPLERSGDFGWTAAPKKPGGN
jgi:hypothetical protein